LEQDGVITGYKALVDYEKTSRPIGALLLINLAEVIPGRGHVPKTEIVGRLRGFEEIEEVTDVQAADFDLIVKARLESLKRLSALIEEVRSIEGIEEISSAVITEEIVVPLPTLFKKSFR
jgi:DNA-binding Lrp family transcriptional regulator